MAKGIDKLSNVFKKINAAVGEYSSKKSMQEVGDGIVDMVVKRTKKGRGADNKPWPGDASRYSPEYRKFKLKRVGKAKPVDLTLTNQMLSALRAIVRGNKRSRTVETKFIPDNRSDSKSKNSTIAQAHHDNNRKFLELGRNDKAKIKKDLRKILQKALRKRFRR